MANSFRGIFNTKDKENEFIAATSIVAPQAFNAEQYITSITMPDVISIGWDAFSKSPLTYIELPKVTLIGDGTFDQFSPFAEIVNDATTIVKIPSGIDSNGDIFNSTKYKDYMFGAGNWDKITFDWIERSPNSFTGTFSTPAKEAEFMGILEEVTANQFNNEPGLTSISLSYAGKIGDSAFSNSPLKSVYLPVANTIGSNCFSDNTGTNQLTFIYAPQAAHVGAGAFSSIVNHTWTHAYLHWGFWTSATNKEYIFGTPHTGYVKFLVDHENGFMKSNQNDNFIDSEFYKKGTPTLGEPDLGRFSIADNPIYMTVPNTANFLALIKKISDSVAAGTGNKESLQLSLYNSQQFIREIKTGGNIAWLSGGGSYISVQHLSNDIKANPSKYTDTTLIGLTRFTALTGHETTHMFSHETILDNKKVIGIAHGKEDASIFIISKASDPYNKPEGYADYIWINGVQYVLQHQVKFQVDRLNHFNNYFTKDTARTYPNGNFGGTGNSILYPTTDWTSPQYAYYSSRTGNTAVAGWTSAQVWQEFIPSATKNPDIWTNMIVGIINHHGLAWLRSKEWIGLETPDKDGNGNYTFGFSPAKLDWRWAYIKT